MKLVKKRGTNMIGDLLNRLSTSSALVFSSGATLVSAVTLNDIAVISGIMATLILGVMNIRRERREKEVHELTLEKKRLENKKLRIEHDRLFSDYRRLVNSDDNDNTQ